MNDEIQIVDVGMGNIASVCNMLRKIGGKSTLVSDPDKLSSASKLILPGVGSFDAGIEALRIHGMDEAVRQAADRGVLVLGICLGMQLLFDGSEEGSMSGLGLVKGRVEKIKADATMLKIPHMGWNIVHPEKESSLFSPEQDEQRFYFVHSYKVVPDDPSHSTAKVNYGVDFTCAVQRENVLGVQFHPEKSHRFGMGLFEKFINL